MSPDGLCSGRVAGGPKLAPAFVELGWGGFYSTGPKGHGFPPQLLCFFTFSRGSSANGCYFVLQAGTLAAALSRRCGSCNSLLLAMQLGDSGDVSRRPVPVKPFARNVWSFIIWFVAGNRPFGLPGSVGKKVCDAPIRGWLLVMCVRRWLAARNVRAQMGRSQSGLPRSMRSAGHRLEGDQCLAAWRDHFRNVPSVCDGRLRADVPTDSASAVSSSDITSRAAVLRRDMPFLSGPLDFPLSAAELQHVLSQLPSHRAPGPDGLPYEFFAVKDDVLSSALLTFFRIGASLGSCPVDLAFSPCEPATQKRRC